MYSFSRAKFRVTFVSVSFLNVKSTSNTNSLPSAASCVVWETSKDGCKSANWRFSKYPPSVLFIPALNISSTSFNKSKFTVFCPAGIVISFVPSTLMPSFTPEYLTSTITSVIGVWSNSKVYSLSPLASLTPKFVNDSLSIIVAVALWSVIVTLSVGLWSTIWKSSLLSILKSSVILTVIVAVVSPATIVNLPSTEV